MEKFNKFLATKSITPEAYQELDEAKMAELWNEFIAAEINAVNDKADKKIGKTDLKGIEDDLQAIKEATEEFDHEEIKSTVADLEEQVGLLKENTNDDPMKLKSFTEAIKDEKDSIKEMLKGGKAVVLKADTLRTAITGNTDALRLPDIGKLGRRERSLYNIFPKFPVGTGNHNGKVRYHDWDEATTVKAAGMVAEGAVFPESTARFQQYEVPLRKVGDTLPVSEEFGEDAPTAAAELEMFLDTNVESEIDDQLVNGNNTGQQLEGIMESTPAYVAANSGIPGANIYDLVKKIRTAIVKNRGSKYKPDFAAMNADTIDLLSLEKDANDNYIFKNDDDKIGPMFIIEDNNIPDNQLVVGDRRYSRIYEMGGVELSKGTVADQFVEDMVTIKARKRLLFLIRNVDRTGFLKVTDVAAALTTLATP